MIDIQDNLLKDMEAVRKIPIVPTMLDVICQTTEMGFAAVARVTPDRWLACSVRDEIEFGLKEGGELKIDTTICNEIRDSRKPVVIDHVEKDPHFKNHPTPKMYGFQSYISVPTILKNGAFFGTLCAIDPKPASLKNPKIIGTFSMFAELLSFHLQSLDLLERSRKTTAALQTENKMLSQVNHDLDTFVYTASHDLKSPIHNIEGLLNALADSLSKESLDKAKASQILELMRTSLRRLGMTIKDLTTIVESDRKNGSENTDPIDIFEMVEKVKQDLDHQITESKAKIVVRCEDHLLLKFSKKNFKSILYNLISNSIKYRSPERCPEVLIKLNRQNEKIKLTVKDNGLGIPAGKIDQVFTLFKRAHDHVEGSGMGLYIVKRMVNHEKGEINVNSTLNIGTTFTISF